MQITSNVENEPPTLLAQPIEGGTRLQVWCPHCRRHHFHGAGAGHRFAHCSPRAHSPYERTGYILRVVDDDA